MPVVEEENDEIEHNDSEPNLNLRIAHSQNDGLNRESRDTMQEKSETVYEKREIKVRKRSGGHIRPIIV